MSKQIGILFVFVVIVSFTATATSNITNPNKNELLTFLLDPNRYESSIVPGFFKGNHTEVAVQFAVTDIYDFSDPGMEFQMILFLRMKWKDTRLAYNENYDKLEIFGDKFDHVWTPDIYFLDERQSGVHKIINEEKLAYIRPDGQVSYSKRLSVTSPCNMDFRKFPFDNQDCKMILQSYALTTEVLVLRWTESHPFQLLNTNLPQFTASFEDNHLTQGTYNFEHSIIGGNFSFLQTSIQLKRNGKSYLSMYIVPYPIFFGLATASFGLKEIGPKVNACSTALSTTILQWIAIYSKLPATAYFSDLDEWILRHIFFIGGIFLYHLAHFWMINLFQKPQSAKQTESESETENDGSNVKPENKTCECSWPQKCDVRCIVKGFCVDKTRTRFTLDLLIGSSVFIGYTVSSVYYLIDWGLDTIICIRSFFGCSCIGVITVLLHYLAYCLSWSCNFI